jgi:hypothetical protein
MSAPDSTYVREPGEARFVAFVVLKIVLALVGLLVGAIAGLFIAGYAGWLPHFNFC